jgi:hypothetical protein
MSRLYVVKVRLQQACDAGVLAGRKVMTDTSLSTALDPAAQTQAQAFFRNNFRETWFQSTAVSFTPTKAAHGGGTVANAVNGAATATVPMALMSFFKVQPAKLDVTCQAVFDMADTDIMFVLDTTGSMSCKPSDPTSCAGAMTPYTRGDGTQASTIWKAADRNGRAARCSDPVRHDDACKCRFHDQVSLRFRDLLSAVNVGQSIPTTYLQNTTHTYQSRRVIGDYDFGTAITRTTEKVTQADCLAQNGQRVPATGYTRTGTETFFQAKRYSAATWSPPKQGTCSVNEQTVRPMWRYEP